MVGWVRNMFAKHRSSEEAPAKQEIVQGEQFEEWGNVMKEVERVQRIATGRVNQKQPIRRRGTH